MSEKFLVEVIFNLPGTIINTEGKREYVLNTTANVYSFEGTNRSAVKYDAEKFMDKTLRHGLELPKRGAVLKSVIHPSCILQVGLVDDNEYQKELAAGAYDIPESTSDGSISPTVTPDTESLVAVGTEVGMEVAG